MDFMPSQPTRRKTLSQETHGGIVMGGKKNCENSATDTKSFSSANTFGFGPMAFLCSGLDSISTAEMCWKKELKMIAQTSYSKQQLTGESQTAVCKRNLRERVGYRSDHWLEVGLAFSIIFLKIKAKLAFSLNLAILARLAISHLGTMGVCSVVE